MIVKKSNGASKTLNEYFTDNGSGLGMIDSAYHKYGQVMGIVLGDGTTMVLTYDLKCPAVDPDSRNDNPTSCIHGWYDINGKKGPNQWGKDIVGFNAGYGKAFTAKGIKGSECNSLKSKLGIKACLYNGDVWAGAVKECGGVSNMITPEDLAEIASASYISNAGPVTLGEQDSINRSSHPGLTFLTSSDAVVTLGLRANTAVFTNEEINYVSVRVRYFNNANQQSSFLGQADRRTGGHLAICKGD